MGDEQLREKPHVWVVEGTGRQRRCTLRWVVTARRDEETWEII